MRKLYLSMLVFSMSFHFTSAQDTLKVTARHFTTELNINPFQGELSLNNALNQIKVRYFLTDQTALRMGLSFNSQKSNGENSTAYGANPYSIKEERKTSTIGLNFGFEKHFKGTKRLSPYLSAELALASKSSSQTTTSNYQSSGVESTVEIEGAWQVLTVVNNNPQLSYGERAFFQYGLNVVGGFDFYVAKNLYLGYEIAFAMLQTNYKDIDITTTPATTNTWPDFSQKQFSIGPNLINGIRVGFVF